jgi:2-polyprenyl-3-methyl-5-hydroxy-6-metoxy-1,4-benzoquinol methylase
MGTLISEGYQTLITKMHATTNWGDGSHRRVDDIVALIKSLGYPTTVLDYGCGKGTLGPAMKARMPYLAWHEYDPGIPGKDTPPTDRFDLVVSTDVLEHIEPEHIEHVLAHIASITGRYFYATIGLELAKHILPDGRNAHILIRPEEWWVGALQKAGFQVLERKPRVKRVEVLCART